MNKYVLFLLSLMMLVLLARPNFAQEHPTTAAHAQADVQPHPAVSENSSWAGSVVIIVLGLFLAAAVIGPVVRVNTPEEVPPAHSHDEPPGTSGHHGKSGTVDLEDPEHEGGGGHGHGH